MIISVVSFVKKFPQHLVVDPETQMVYFELLVIYEYLGDKLLSHILPITMTSQSEFLCILVLEERVCLQSFTCICQGPGTPAMSMAGEVPKESNTHQVPFVAPARELRFQPSLPG